jgi:hypothetical protein
MDILKRIKDFWDDLCKDQSFFIFLFGIVLIFVVGVMDSGYRYKLKKSETERYILMKERQSNKETIDRQNDLIKKQKEAIDELLKELEKENKSKIYAKT